MPACCSYVNARRIDYNLAMECVLCHKQLPEWAVFCPACNTQQPGAVECEDIEYAAFISYRHSPTDQSVALAVQKAIEHFKLPRTLSSPTQVAPGRRLGRVFRDEDELPAAHSLPDRITDALMKSHSLIVVCSPEMRTSMWVKREVETFAYLHGCDRIFAVLASGNELENIPEILRSKTVIGPDGAPRIIATEPLAADFRLESHNRMSLEKLRIIASVAGCDFDDLRQRSQKRKRRIAVSITAMVVLMGCVLGVFGLRAHEEHQRALFAESYQLAIQSQQLLEQGDRYGAIESALAALPKSSADNRDYAPIAEDALEAALQVYPSNAAWLTCYSIETESPIGDRIDGSSFYDASIVDGTSDLDSNDLKASAITVNEKKGWFAYAQKDGTVAIHDIETGRRIQTFRIGEDGQPMTDFTSCDLAFVGNTLLLRAKNATQSKLVAIEVDGDSLTFKWADDTEATNLVVSDQGQLAIAGLAYGRTLKAWLLSPDDGKKLSEVTAEIGDFAYDATDPEASSGVFHEKTGDLYLAFGSLLVRVDAQAGTLGESGVQKAQLANKHVGAAQYANGLVIVASYGDGDEGKNIPYAIEAFDSSLKRIWKNTGQYSGSSIVREEDNGRIIVYGNPNLCGAALNDGSVISASVGRHIMLIDTRSGEMLYDEAKSCTVVGLSPNTQDASKLDDIVLVVATRDGAVMGELPFTASGTYTRSFTTMLSEPIRWARACCPKYTRTNTIGIGLYVIALSAENESKVFVYRSSFIVPKDKVKTEGDYSLDELRSLAHDTLKAAGRE